MVGDNFNCGGDTWDWVREKHLGAIANVLTPSFPCFNTARRVTESTLDQMGEEFQRGKKLLERSYTDKKYANAALDADRFSIGLPLQNDLYEILGVFF